MVSVVLVVAFFFHSDTSGFAAAFTAGPPKPRSLPLNPLVLEAQECRTVCLLQAVLKLKDVNGRERIIRGRPRTSREEVRSLLGSLFGSSKGLIGGLSPYFLKNDLRGLKGIIVFDVF